MWHVVHDIMDRSPKQNFTRSGALSIQASTLSTIDINNSPITNNGSAEASFGRHVYYE